MCSIILTILNSREEMFLLQRLLKQWEKMLNMFVLEFNKEF